MRRMRVSVDGHVVFDDELEKGCGNQVFDYGKSIKLRGDADSSDSPHDSARDRANQSETNAKQTAQIAAKTSAKSLNDVILPLELLNQPSEYDEQVDRDSQRGFAQNGGSAVIHSKSASNVVKRPQPEAASMRKSKSDTNTSGSKSTPSRPGKSVAKSASDHKLIDLSANAVEKPTESSENPAGLCCVSRVIVIILIVTRA